MIAVTEAEKAAAPAIPFAEVQQVNMLDVSQRHEQTLAIFLPINKVLKPKHAQLFFSNIEHPNPSNDQQMKGQCFNCKHVVASTKLLALYSNS